MVDDGDGRGRTVGIYLMMGDSEWGWRESVDEMWETD